MVLGKILIIVAVILLAVLFQFVYLTYYVINPIPKFETTWWGPGEPTIENLTVTPFKINISENVLGDLKERLFNHRPFTPPLEGITHEYGLNTLHFQEIVKYWKSDYNWTKREDKLNLLPQYTINIQGLSIHFIHFMKRDDVSESKIKYLLLLHDWPNTNLEFSEVIGYLAAHRSNFNFAFEIIVPSLPGFGFSDKPVKSGLGVVQMGVLLNNFMTKLGKRRYYIHGEGLGAVIAENMALLYPDRVYGVHSNWCIAFNRRAWFKTLLGEIIPWLADTHHYDKMYPLSQKLSQLFEESANSHFQFTKPDTIAIGFHDSPVALAAYIFDIFISPLKYNMKDSKIEDDKVDLTYSYDKLLDNIMIYWATGSITSSMKLFAEYYRQFNLIANMNEHFIKTPFVCSRLQNETIFQTTSILQTRYENLVEIRDMPLTVRYPALEEPYYLGNEIWESVDEIINYNFTMKNRINLTAYTSEEDEF